MNNIEIKKLTSCGSDWETNRYSILKLLKEWRAELTKYKVYPFLNDAEKLQNLLQEILSENIATRGWLERETQGRLVDDTIVVTTKAHQLSFQLDKLIEFVDWSLLQTDAVLEEAYIIRNFVEKDLKIFPFDSEERFKGKGYFVIPNNKRSLINIYLYDLTINWTVDEPVRSLELELIRSVPKSFVEFEMKKFIKDFISYSQTLYEPMVYICSTDLDFPFRETIFPVAKTKLLKLITY